MNSNTNRPQIDSFEFQAWASQVEGEDPDLYADTATDRLYDLWAEGYAPWEVLAIIG